MKKEVSHINRVGASVVEIIVASALFAFLVLMIVGIFIRVERYQQISSDYARAVFLAEEGIEATRSIRDDNFSSLVEGTHGLSQQDNRWIFSGTSDSTEYFTRSITIDSQGDNIKQVTSRIVWNSHRYEGDVLLYTTFTNWKAEVQVDEPQSCEALCESLAFVGGQCRQNAVLCLRNGEIFTEAGNQFCSGGPSADTCCCQP